MMLNEMSTTALCSACMISTAKSAVDSGSSKAVGAGVGAGVGGLVFLCCIAGIVFMACCRVSPYYLKRIFQVY